MTRAELERVQASLESAVAQHGEKFHQAFGELVALDPDDPQACATIKQIWESSDPGSMVLEVVAAMLAARASARH